MNPHPEDVVEVGEDAPPPKSRAEQAVDAWDNAITQQDKTNAAGLMAMVLRRQVLKPSADPLRAMPFELGHVVTACMALQLQSGDVARMFPKLGQALEQCIPEVTEAIRTIEAAGAEAVAAAQKAEAAKLRAQMAEAGGLEAGAKAMFDEATAEGVADDD